MTGRLRLAPVTEAELPMLEALTNDPDSGEFGWFGWHDRFALRRQWQDNGLLGEDGGKLLAIRDDEAVGFVSFRRNQTSRTSYCWEIGISLRQAARGHGYGAEAQLLLARYLFAHTPVNRVEAGTELGNVAEQRALEKAGFTREGVLRGVVFRDGRWRDGVQYGMVRDDLA